MCEVKALFRPQRLDQVLAALREIPDLPGVTVSGVHAYAGSHRPDHPAPPADDIESDFMKLQTIVPTALSERVVAAIARAGHTGRAGDGIVFVVPVEGFVRIRDVGDASSATSHPRTPRA
jgi:nitrogen regulatory protein P-II 1